LLSNINVTLDSVAKVT